MSVKMQQVYLVAGVSKQAHHQFARRDLQWRLSLEELLVQVDLLRAAHPGCGLEKLYWTLRPQSMGRDKFIAVFQQLGYGVKKTKSFLKTTYPTHLKVPNLITGIRLDGPDQLWQSDITYVVVGDRFYYLVFIIDVYTKQIKGYAVSDHLRAEANLTALKRALQQSSEDLRGLIHHSDRGSQYVNKKYQQALKARGILMSMGSKGQENAYAERINGIMKNEYLYYRTLTSLAVLKKHVKKDVNHYNHKRIHQHLPGRQSPNQFAETYLHLRHQDKPTVIVYAEGKCKMNGGSTPVHFEPRTRPLVHDCPIVNS